MQSGDIFEVYSNSRVDLRRSSMSALLHTGVFVCRIPTNAVHDDDGGSMSSAREAVYVGLYGASGGKFNTPTHI